jgi:superfamily II DNA or RNA helicase
MLRAPVTPSFPITEQHLRSVEAHVYERGAAYHRDGRVLSCTAEDGGLTGAVAGDTVYSVWVAVSDDRELVVDCTCPAPYTICKHAVALVLHHLGERAAPRAAPATSQHADAFATRDELLRFAEAHRVQHELAISAEALLADIARGEREQYWLRSILARLALRDLGSLADASRHAPREVAAAISAAAHRALHRAAAAVRDGIAEEGRRPAAATDPALAPLWSRLALLRRQLREHAPPRSRAAREASAWSFDAEARVVSWKEPARLVRTRDYSTAPIAARLAMPGGGEPRIECTCEAPNARCAHALALVDATLDRLEDPARAAEARALAEELLRPAWDRALRELDRLEARAARPRAAIEVWWIVEDELGGWSLSARVKKAARGGGTTRGAKASLARLLDEHRDALDERDLRVAEELAAWNAARAGGGSRLVPTYPVRAFAALVGHPRVASAAAPDEPIEVARADLGFNALPAGDEIRLEPAVRGERLPPKLLEALLQAFQPGEPLLLVEPERRRCLVVHVGDEARALWGVLAQHGDAFPPESHAALLERLSRLEARLPLAVPSSLKGRELAADAACVARLQLAPEGALSLELFVRPAAGLPLFHPGAGPRDLLVARGGERGGERGERGYVRRDLAGEPARVRALLAALPLEGAEEGPPWCFQLPDAQAALALVAALQEPPPGLEAEWLDERPAISRAPGAEALRVQIEKKRDWFGIAGELKLETGRLELAVLLDAARRQQRFVRVDPRRWIELSDALRRQLLAIADQVFAARAHLELSPGAVPAIRALTEAGARVDAAPAWKLATERLATAIALRPRPPAKLAGTLRDYQVLGHAWLARIAAWAGGACLADDMGLGKTIQAIALLLDRARHGPALVIAPTSATYNWLDELRRFAPTLRPVLYTEQRGQLAALRKHDVVVASYGLLVRDADALAAVRFGTLVLDEAQALKNPGTHRARAARRLDAGFRLALSGTPLENHLGELWSLCSIICPGLLGSWEQFRERFATPIERGKDPEARAALARVLRPFLLRRTKAEVARELPPRIEIAVPIALSAEEQAMYDDARLAAVAELTGQGADAAGEDRRFAILAALTRLRLLACHPRLHDPTSKLPSSKLRRLLELLEELRSEGHRALVFSQFTSHLALVREELERVGLRALYLDGATPAAERAARIRAFQAGDGDAFLISLKAGGTGINLTAADYVIHLDPWWNPAVEDQATDRAHRIGQTRPVTVYRLIARGTIEEQILALHRDKRALVAGVLEGTGAAARLSARDLLALLRAPTEVPGSGERAAAPLPAAGRKR